MKRSLSGFDPLLVSMYGNNEMNGFFDSITGFLDKTGGVVNKGAGVFSSITDLFSTKSNPPPKPAGFNYQSLILPGAIIGGAILIKMLKK
jgi:hypothetical protein